MFWVLRLFCGFVDIMYRLHFDVVSDFGFGLCDSRFSGVLASGLGGVRCGLVRYAVVGL